MEVEQSQTEANSPPGVVAKGSCSPLSRLEQFRLYRDEDKHECNLISIRVNALLTSQSLFLTASAILYSNAIVGKKSVLISIGVLSLAASFLCLRAIWIGCRVLHKWHRHGQQLIDEDATGSETDPKGQLVGYHLGRKQPDPDHTWSVVVFSVGLAVLFCVFWIAAIGWLAAANL